MRRLFVLPVLLLMLVACVPQFAGNNLLSIAATGVQTATVTFQPPAGTYDVVLFIGDAQRILSAAPELTCSAFETGWQCLADRLDNPVAVTVFADPLNLASVQAWWSVPGRPVNLARAAL